MKNVKRIGITFLLCMLMMTVFTACHSHEPQWKIDKERHWKECSCGEISEEGEHNFEEEICAVCGAERKSEDGILTDMGVCNDYGDWVQWLYFDEEGNLTSESTAEYTYDKKGNKLTDKLYEDGQLVSFGEYELDSQGISFKKYETEEYEDGSRCVYEYNESGDSMGYVLCDEEGNITESYRTEYITDEEDNLLGEKVYENEVLTQEISYASAKNEEEEFLYAEEVAHYSEDGSKLVEKYDENGELISELSYDAEGKKIYEYDLEYFYDEDGNHVSTEKRENGKLKQEVIYEYDEEGNVTAEKTYEGKKLVKEIQYAEAEYFFYEAKVITYNDDGTTTVEEYDENGELIE